MSWTFDEIQRHWFGGPHLDWDPEDVERAFNLAETIRGRDWVMGSELDFSAFPGLVGIGPGGGLSEFLRIYWFGQRMSSIVGAPGSEELLRRLLAEDADASEEATAIHLLRSDHITSTVLELAPATQVGDRERRPDFRLRRDEEHWVYVEVTKLHRSTASTRIQQLLQRVGQAVMSVEREFILEIVFNRDPTLAEEEQVVLMARSACEATDEQRRDIGDVASVLVKSGSPAMVVPSLVPDDNRPRMAVTQALVGPDRRGRQILARIPFEDQRAEDVLSAEAKQLPKNECGIVMVNVNLQPSAFESWSKRVPERFASQHTRVAAVILFMHAISQTAQGLVWLPSVRMILNPHAHVALPEWIRRTIDRIREDSRRLTGRAD